MARNDVTIGVKVDAGDAESELKKIGKAGEQAGQDLQQGLAKGAKAATREIDDLIARVSKLGAEKATIELKLAQQDLTRQLEDIMADVEKLDAADASIDLKMEQGDALITDIDRIESKLKEIGATPVRVNVDAPAANLGRLGQSADGAKSALANMTGNASQDLVNLGGIAGSAGVAVGQLTEYFTDARLNADNAGKSFGNLAAEFAKPAALIGGIGVAVGVGTKLWGDYQAAQKEVARQTEEVGKALADLSGIVDQINESLAKQADVGDFGDKLLSSLTLTDEKITKVLGAANELGIAFTDVGDVIAGLGEKGDLEGLNLLVESLMQTLGLSRDDAEDLARVLGVAGTNFGLLKTELVGTSDLTADWAEKNRTVLELYGQIAQVAKDTDINETAKRYLETLRLTNEGLQQIADAKDRLAGQQIFNPSEIQIAAEIGRASTTIVRSMEELNRSAQESQQIARATAQNWGILLDDLADGKIDTQAAADAWNILQTALKLTNEEMQTLVDQRLGEQLEDSKATAEELAGSILEVRDANEQAFKDEAAQAIENITEAMANATERAEELRLAVGDITESITDINADDFDNLTGGFKDALDAANDLSSFKFRIDFDEAMAGTDGFLAQLSGKFKPDILELADFMKANLGVNVSDSITWGEVDKDDPEFASLVVDMTSMIKEGASKAYAEGGEEAAKAFVTSQAQALVNAVPGLTLADVYRLLGLPADGSLDAIIKPIVDAEAKADALATLDALIGVDPDNPILAQIKLAVQTKSIDPVIAEVAALMLAGTYNVDVTAQLAEFTPEQKAAALTAIANMGPAPISVTPELEPTWFDSLWATPPDPVPVPVELEAPNAGDIDRLITAVADRKRVANLKVTADNAGAIGKIIDAVASKSRTADITANAKTTQADLDLDTLAAQQRTAYIDAHALTFFADQQLDAVTAPRSANINVRADNAGQVDRILDDVANPGGSPRYADIYVRTHNTAITTPGGGSTAPPDDRARAAVAGFAAGDEVGINPLAGDTIGSSYATPIGVPGGVSTSSAPQVVHNHVTVQAAVIGSRFDVQRAVSKALRQAQRLNGTRAA